MRDSTYVQDETFTLGDRFRLTDFMQSGDGPQPEDCEIVSIDDTGIIGFRPLKHPSWEPFYIDQFDVWRRVRARTIVRIGFNGNTVTDAQFDYLTETVHRLALALAAETPGKIALSFADIAKRCEEIQRQRKR